VGRKTWMEDLLCRRWPLCKMLSSSSTPLLVSWPWLQPSTATAVPMVSIFQLWPCLIPKFAPSIRLLLLQCSGRNTVAVFVV
jgi:hypothetical protein